MSEVGQPTDSAADARLHASHNRRLMFETFCYMAGGGVVLAASLVLLFGIVMRPESHYMLVDGKSVLLPDWGKSIVDRINQSWDALLAMVMALGGWTGLTQLRGYFDAKLGKGGAAK